MNRKLHNTVTALFATSGLLVLSLMAANPAPSPTAPVLAPLVVQPALDTAALDTAAIDEAALGDVIGFAAEAATLSKPARKRTSGRQSVAMPFFSFAPRG